MRKEIVTNGYSLAWRYHFDNPMIENWIDDSMKRSESPTFSEWKYQYVVEVAIPKYMINKDGTFNDEFTDFVDRKALHKWRKVMFLNLISTIEKQPLELLKEAMNREP